LARADSWGLPQLMASLAQVQTHEARFTEKKTIALLKAPVESSGILRYRRPDHVEKHILQPKEEILVIDGDEVSMQEGAAGKRHSMRLQNNPALEALAESMRATMAGDLSTLRRYFAVKLEGSQAHWTLTLTPAEDTMRRNLKVLNIEGQADQVTQIRVAEVGGDTSVMVLQHD
jgi:outer membrane lipoprotein-sorting protein